MAESAAAISACRSGRFGSSSKTGTTTEIWTADDMLGRRRVERIRHRPIRRATRAPSAQRPRLRLPGERALFRVPIPIRSNRRVRTSSASSGGPRTRLDGCVSAAPTPHLDPQHRHVMDWSLIVGTGARLADLRAFLVPESSEAGCARLASLEDLDEFAELETGPGRVVLDADALELEDVGLVRRFVRRAEEWELVLAGNDGSRRAVRALLAGPRTRWLAWPPDLDDLHALMRAPGSEVG